MLGSTAPGSEADGRTVAATSPLASFVTFLPPAAAGRRAASDTPRCPAVTLRDPSYVYPGRKNRGSAYKISASLLSKDN